MVRCCGKGSMLRCDWCHTQGSDEDLTPTEGDDGTTEYLCTSSNRSNQRGRPEGRRPLPPLLEPSFYLVENRHLIGYKYTEEES